MTRPTGTTLLDAVPTSGAPPLPGWASVAAQELGHRHAVRHEIDVRDGFGRESPAVFLVLLRGMWQGFPSARPRFVSPVIAAPTDLVIPGAKYVVAGALAGVVAARVLTSDP